MRMPRYQKYKSSGIEWLGDVPEHWESKRFRFLLARNDGGVWGDEDDPEGTIVLRSTEQTIGGGWRIEDPARRVLTEREMQESMLLAGDLVITKSSGSASHIGKTSLVTEEVANLKACFSNFMQRLRFSQGFEPQLGAYFLNCPAGRQQLVFNSNTTTGLANLNGTVLGDVLTCVPPLKEQLVIADFLARETAKIDTLVTKKRTLVERLKEKRTVLISRAVTRGLPPEAARVAGLDPRPRLKSSGIDWLGDVPEHWTMPPLYTRYHVDLGKMLNEGAIRGDHLVPYLRNVDVQWDRTNVSNLPEMDIGPWQLARYTVKRGDVLVCEGGEVGRAAMVGEDAHGLGYQKALHRLRPLAVHEAPRFMFYTLFWAAHQGVFVAGGNPNTIPHLTGEKLRQYRFPAPPKAEQHAIAAFLDRETAKLDQMSAKVEVAIECLQEYRAALITAAVTGKIDVRGQSADNRRELASAS